MKKNSGAKKPKKKKNVFRSLKRFILALSIILFCGISYAVYSTSHSTFSSRTGRVVVWSTSTVLTPLAKSTPLWVRGGMLIGALYLWYKHKLIMSVVYGIIAGIYFAI